MNTTNFYDDFDDDAFTEKYAPSGKALRSTIKNSKKLANPVRQFINSQDDSRFALKFTYKVARFEEGWLLNSLGGFYEHGWISDVLRRVKGGKEASVYLCHSGSEVKADFIAAKVYRPRSLRNLKNDHAYREGRGDLDNEGKAVLDGGMQHAMAKRTEYGKTLLHQSWISYEFTSMQRLYSAGADVPMPYEMADNAILMGYIGDLDGCAPTLNEVSLDPSEARPLFNRVIRNIDLLLANECIHGDLSSYNILYWEGDITFIDFPQVISPKKNRNAFGIFQRDVSRVCEYFAKQGVHADSRKIARELWEKNGYQTKPEVDIRLLDDEDPQDLAFWKNQKGGK